MTVASLTADVKRLGLELGFARIGIAAAEPLAPEAERLRAWLANGYHGTMEYMQRTAAVRVDPGHAGMLPEARSVIVLAAAYGRSAAQGPGPGRVARYALGRDYHDVLHRRLRGLTKLLRECGHAARAAVDSMPVMERAWAERAGIGFIGKNCCLIVPGIGSHVFLAAVITSAALQADERMRERCGECRLCLDHCPTGAFAAPRVMDARRCISYLTIEHRGSIAEELRPAIGDWIFGCDACQDVCPYNRAARANQATCAEFAPSPALGAAFAERLLGMDDAAFADFARGSALRRTKREGMARNAALVLGNARSRRALPVLQHAAGNDPSEVVREAASWAIDRLGEAGDVA
jgi:epoxyqueuosine reductase